jgi:hypothetical protein
VRVFLANGTPRPWQTQRRSEYRKGILKSAHGGREVIHGPIERVSVVTFAGESV